MIYKHDDNVYVLYISCIIFVLLCFSAIAFVITTEEVTLQLLMTKCIPVLIYGLECFSLPKSDLKSLDFAVTRFLMKLFRTSNMEIIAEYQHYFGFSLPSKLIERKRNKFVNNYKNVSLL